METKIARKNETVGGWVWYVRNWKEANPGKEADMKDLMKKYTTGVKWEDA